MLLTKQSVETAIYTPEFANAEPSDASRDRQHRGQHRTLGRIEGVRMRRHPHGRPAWREPVCRRS
jgi:hypothetical protein